MEEKKVSILQKAQARVSPEAAGLLEKRVQRGLETYGMTLDENPAPLEERLQHALEEALDLLQYLEWAKQVAPEGLLARLDEMCELAAAVASVLVRERTDEPPDDPGGWVEWRDLEGPDIPAEF
jgi:hypothetical protein